MVATIQRTRTPSHRHTRPFLPVATSVLVNRSERQRYHHATRTATYGFLAALPLLLMYEVAILFVGRGVRVGADVWMKWLLAVLGPTGWAALGVAVLAIGIVVFWAERHRRPPIRAKFFGWLLVESAVYAVVLALIVSTFVGALFLMVPVAQIHALPLSTQLALSLGAGLYEELVFRVLLVGGLYLGLRKLLPDRAKAYLIAAVVGALIFSWVHYVGPFGDLFTLVSFTYRFVFGLALNAVFLLRGFAVVAWTHALYDVMVVTGML
jgi:membrane protease YdiL (CAAX protease family)